jgi:hypothetical protein
MQTTAAATGAFSSAVMLACVTLQGGSFTSADAARGLVQVLDRIGATAAACEDPTEPGTFVAALYVPGSQLLVVSARHPSVDGLNRRLEAGQFLDVYLDLQGSPTPMGKFFVQDAGADGILSAQRGSGEVDVVYEDGARQTLFNGDARAQHLSEHEYDAKLVAADARYARLLTLLADAIQRPGSSS